MWDQFFKFIEEAAPIILGVALVVWAVTMVAFVVALWRLIRAMIHYYKRGE